MAGTKYGGPLEKDFTASLDKYPNSNFKKKPCKWCGEIFQPVGPCHKYCSDTCRRTVYADKHYRRTYGVGVDWVRSKLEEQGHVCAICKTVGFKMRDDHYSGMNLDHDHDTGEPRGLLCHNCNRALGLFQDDPDIIKEALRYVSYKYDL